MARGDASRLLKRAAVLHTDIATLVDPRLKAPPGASPVPGPGVSILINDGRFSSYDTDGVQWDFTRRVLDHVPPGPSHDAAVRTWYRAVAAYHVHHLDYGELGRHLGHARRTLRDDAVLAMMAGVRHQAFASARVQASLATIALPPGMQLAVGERDRELRAARQAFQEALTLDPGLVEARVRLGRALADEGRPAEAADQLRAALAVADDPVLQYLAALFLGEQEAALGHGEDAASAFERARASYPTAPSPHLALSHLARARGDRGAAMAALDRAMRLAGSRAADDPWWSFASSSGRDWEAQLDAARLALAAEVSP
jgi:tetratricopeptide (TPR) repeat protein